MSWFFVILQPNLNRIEPLSVCMVYSWQTDTIDMPHCCFPTPIIYRKIFVHIKYELRNKVDCILGPRNE